MEAARRRLLGERVSADVPEGVVVRRGGLIPRVAGVLSGMGGAAHAVTLGDTIVVHPSAPLTPRLLRHELAHVRQWRAGGLLFPLRYTIGHLVHGYHRNPYEIEARAAEREV
ncbi:MAG TPA: DUF4157 domain-containing protein [Longimicrobiales bacterium]|nr:DUF4157 domain-containing protein [Longimicrobiales bacterium]